MELFIYVLTLSLQLSGSLLLLFSSLGNVKVKVINDCIGGNSLLVSKNQIVNLGEKEVQSSLQNVYMNRESFLVLSIGYLLAIFNSYEVENHLMVLMVTILVVAFLCIVLYSIARKISKINAKKYCNISIDKLPNGTTFYEVNEEFEESRNGTDISNG